MNRKTYTLASGDKIPAIGLGTWQSGKNEVSEAVKHALSVGKCDVLINTRKEKEQGQGLNDGNP